MAGGFSADWRSHLVPQRDTLASILEPAAPAPVDNSPAALSARYGTSPETVSQWATMNGFGQPQGSAAPRPSSEPLTPSPAAPAGTPLNPTGTASPATPGGNPTNFASYLQQLQSRVNSSDPSAGINDAFRQMREYVGQQTVGEATGQMGARGLLPSDNTSQDLKAVLMGKAMTPIQAQHAAALSQAQQQGLDNQMSLARMMGDTERQTQQQQWEQQKFEYQKSQDAANRAFQQSQYDASQRAQQQQTDFLRQQWEAQQKQLQTQNVAGGLTDASGNAIAPQSSATPAPGGLGPEAAAARAKILGGSGGLSLGDILGGSGGGGTDFLPTLHAGGAGSASGGSATPGWNSGAGRSGDPNQKPFGATTGTTPGAGSSGSGSSGFSSLTSGIASSVAGAGSAAKTSTSGQSMAPKPPAPLGSTLYKPTSR